jgi:NTE family protein
MAMSGGSPRIGIALGGGAARGWAHIGVLRALAERGIEPEVVCGTSIGALVGGIYAAGYLEELEAWVSRLTRRDVLRLVDLTVGGGALGGKRLMELYREHFPELPIEALPRRFAAVATDLRSGAEVWLQQGSLLTAIRASISLPGLFTPVLVNGRWLADGSLVNPVPVSVCRALGAEIVIAIDLNANRMIRAQREAHEEATPAVVQERPRWSGLGRLLPGRFGREQDQPDEVEMPGVMHVVATSLDIMQDRISRSRLAGDPPDLLLAPHLGDVEPLEFSGGGPTIEEGYHTVQRMLPAIDYLLGLAATV